MNKHLRIAGEHALATGFSSTTGGANACTTSGNALPQYDPIAYVARKLWPAKTAEHLAEYLDCSLRTAKYMLSPSERKLISVKFFRRMFFREHGEEFLKGWMSQSDAEWWQRLADLEKQAEENERQLAAIRQAIKSA